MSRDQEVPWSTTVELEWSRNDYGGSNYHVVPRYVPRVGGVGRHLYSLPALPALSSETLDREGEAVKRGGTLPDFLRTARSNRSAGVKR